VDPEERLQMAVETTLLNNRFSLKLPEEWEDRSVYYLDGPVQDKFSQGIVVVVDHDVGPYDLDQFAERRIRAVERELSGYQELKRGPLTLDKKLPAYEIVFKWCPVEGVKQYKRVVYTLAKGTGYTLSATFTKKSWKIRGGEVDKILKSFSVPEPSPSR
jgi:hypothetical protein